MNWIGFYTLIDKEFYRFIRLSRQTVIPPIISTVMFILIFGYSLGSRIQEIQGFPYIIFILPGLAQMGVIANSYANSSTSLFMARMEKSIENMMVAPLHHFQVVSSYMIGAILRGLVVGFTTIGCSAFFIKFPHFHYVLITVSIILTSFLFGGLGILSALFAESWDKIATFTNFVLTPFIYLGGVFYSIKMLPSFWYKVSLFNPVHYCVDLMRFGFLEKSDSSILVSFSIIGGASLFIYLLCIYLFWKGYKIVK